MAQKPQPMGKKQYLGTIQAKSRSAMTNDFLIGATILSGQRTRTNGLMGLNTKLAELKKKLAAEQKSVAPDKAFISRIEKKIAWLEELLRKHGIISNAQYNKGR